MAEQKQKQAKSVKKYSPKKACPKCGPGVRLAEHSDRRACGKCGYFEKK
ncbi:MAG: 30S ribosomal protein S27ae [Candidatus Micrarchaeota archaeon]|nr:30S ribosomal protein S27ae [Candidatus Micrarchaeota archaeon]